MIWDRAWKELTGLPFVFAAWISNKPLDPSFLLAFNEANRSGLDHIEAVVAENPFPFFDLRVLQNVLDNIVLTIPNAEGWRKIPLDSCGYDK